MKAANIVVNANTSFLFKGPYGFGKTLAAASYALGGEIFIAYFDKQQPVELKTFFTEKRFGELAKKILNNIDYEIYGSSNCNMYLNKLIDLSNRCSYYAVITDSVTNLTSAAVNWSLGFKSPAKRNTSSISIPDWDEYKTETSLVTQAIDIGKTLPANVIWTCHPLPQTKIEGSGGSMKITKTNSIVTYGSKAAGIIPGNFTEIYHFSQQGNWDAAAGKSSKKYLVSFESIGDEFAKSPLLGDFIKEIDITDKLFYLLWKEQLDKSMGIIAKDINEKVKLDFIDPFKSIKSPTLPEPNETTKWRV
jgi:hypothetical protein